MITKILAIAENTFKEAIRNRVLYTILAFGILMFIVSFFIANLSAGEEIKTIKDAGLGFISVFGILLAIYIGVSLFYKEIDRRTIYTLVSKPLPRYHLILGKFLGISFTLFFQIFFMSLILYLFLFIVSFQVDPKLLLAILMIFVEFLIIVAVTLFFSSFSTPFLSGLFSMSVFIIGHLIDSLDYYASKIGNLFFTLLVTVVKFLFPNLEYFNLKGRVVHNLYIENSEIITALGYAFVWISILLIFASVIFSKRDFK